MFVMCGYDSVSVPSRGLCFQSEQAPDDYIYVVDVSVPSRGLCFQSRDRRIE